MTSAIVNGQAMSVISAPAAKVSDDRDAIPSGASRPAAILYVPGILGRPDEFETIVAKLTEALTTFGGTMSSRYKYLKTAAQLKPAPAEPTTGYTILEDSGAGPVARFEVFKLDYEERVVGEYARAHVLLKALQLILTLRWLVPAIWQTAHLGYRKTPSQRNQLRYAVLILIGVALYFILTFVAIVQIVVTTLAPKVSNPDVGGAAYFHWSWLSNTWPGLAFLSGGAVAPAPVWSDPHAASFASTATSVATYTALWCRFAFETAYHQTVVIAGAALIAHAPVIALVLTALGLLSPGLRANFENVMNHMLAAIEYFRIGFARNSTTGLFYDAYDDLCKATDRYANVHVMGYGFGSLVALDALFYTRGVAQERIDRLGNLVTIGAPITMSQHFWPKHFDVIRSHFSASSSHAWINAQCALDVVASPILDRVGGQVVVMDTSAGPRERQHPSDWEVCRRSEVERQATAVARDGGDPNNINFSRAVNLDYSGWYPLNLSWPEFLSLAALRAHVMYWPRQGERGYNVFDRIAPFFTDAPPPALAFAPRRIASQLEK